MQGRNSRLAVLLGMLSLAATAQASTHVVDNQHPAAADTNPGTREAPLRTISAAASRAVAGDEVLVRPGLYRERVTLTNSGAPGKPIVFRSAEPRKAVISGSDVVTDWQAASPGVWVRDVPHVSINKHALPHKEKGGEWVYVNGVPMHYAETLERLIPGTFHIDFEKKKLFLAPEEGATPNNAVVEYAHRQGLIHPDHPLDDIHIVGFTVIHNAEWISGHRPAIMGSGQRWLIADNHVLWASAGGITTEFTKDAIVRGNLIEWVGIAGIGGGVNWRLLVETNTVRYCGWRRNDPSNIGTGGSKWLTTIDSIVRGNEFYGNYGSGLWFDFHNCDDLFEDNISHDNSIWGIMSEFNWNMITRGNICYNNGYGIMLAQNTGAVVERNFCFNDSYGIYVRGDGKSPITPTPADWVEKTFISQIRQIPGIDPMVMERMSAGGRKMYTAPPTFLVNNSLFFENMVFDNDVNYSEARNYAAQSPVDSYINNFSDYNIWYSAKPHNGFHHGGGAYPDGLEGWRKASNRDKNSVELKEHPRSAKNFPAWAEAKRSLWDVKVRSLRELGQLGLVSSPEGLVAQIRASRSATLEPVAFRDGTIRAFRFEVDGQPVLGLWTTSPYERRYVRLGLGQERITLENGYLMKTEKRLVNEAIDLVISYVPTYLRGVGATVQELPSNRMTVQIFNRGGEPVPVTATFVNSGTASAPAKATFTPGSGFKAEPAEVSFRLPPGQAQTVIVNLIPQGEPKRGPSQVLMDACVAGERLVRLASFVVGESEGKIPSAQGEIKIDGKLEDWGALITKGLPVGVVVDAAQFAGGKKDEWKGPKDLSGKVFAVWTQEMLYVAICVEDDSIVPALPGGEPWNVDSIELFVDGRAFDMQWQKEPAGGCYQICVSPGKGDAPVNAMVYLKTLEGLQAATSLAGSGYIVEIGIPLTDRNFPAGAWKEGRPVKLSVLFNDKDDPSAGSRKYTFGWAHSPGGANVNDTTGWQTLTLDK